MANKIEFTFKLVGGPHDGRYGKYHGKSEHSLKDVFDKTDKFEMDGHKYLVVEKDYESKLLTLMY